MTVEEARKEIIESGIKLGAGDYVDIEALEVAAKALEEVEQYRAIGTVEELKKMKADYAEAIIDWRQYKKIGTIERFRELTEKAEPKKYVEKMVCDTEVWVCPVCGNGIFSGQKYCDECGQAISDDWE